MTSKQKLELLQNKKISFVVDQKFSEHLKLFLKGKIWWSFNLGGSL
jgi:hypothetical protein